MRTSEAELDFTSGITNIERKTSLSEWAIEFIKAKDLIRETYTIDEAFRNLPRQQKDAVRYQLRKLGAQDSPVSHSVPRSGPPSRTTVKRGTKTFRSLLIGKLVLGAWISGFLLIDIVKIYEAKGATSIVAWQAAILVELCLVLASLSHKSRMRKIDYALYCYNSILFAVMEIDQISIRNSQLSAVRRLADEKAGFLIVMKDQLKEQLSEHSKTLKRLELDHSRGFVSSGALAFESTSKAISANKLQLEAKISSTETEIESLTQSSHSKFWIFATALLYFSLRCLLQFFSIGLLDPDPNGRLRI